MHDGPPPRDRPGGPAGSPPHHGRAAGASESAPPDLHALARDWITLWQSELTAAAADREVQETWQTLAGLWAGAAAAMLHGLPRGAPDGRPAPPAPASPGAAAPARPAPAAAAPDARDAEIERLAGRIAELERRLADLERGGG
jgi:hypothetical protein